MWSLLTRTARRAMAGLAMALALAPGVAPAAVACPGDCAGDGSVSIENLVMGVNIALGSQPISACRAMDSSGEGSVTVDDLIRAVTAALNGCPPAATPTETAPAPSETPLPPTDTPAAPTDTPAPPSETPVGPTFTATPVPTGGAAFCDLPGSVQHTAPGISVVPGGASNAPDLSFMQLPVGFCAHFFARVGNVRQLRFAPGGDLFVASPTKFTTSNGPNGRNAILILPDDDGDGTAEAPIDFMTGMNATVGMLFANDSFYYQNEQRILRMPFAPGDRAPSGESEEVANIATFIPPLHWPKTLDIKDDGTIYVTNGGEETDPCPLPANQPYRGAILKIGDDPGGTLVAKGFRNPVSLHCVRGFNLCFAIELTLDYSTPQGGREKLLPVRDGDDWGFPCCATKDRPYDNRPGPDCSGVAQEIDSFFVGHTPFDLDFELGKWPDPWGRRAYVPLHGKYGSWEGARVVGIELDRMTGMVLPGSDLMGTSTGAMEDFATGWSGQPPLRQYGRPTVVAFAPDGRLFLGNDTSGDIIWIAPMGLAPTP